MRTDRTVVLAFFASFAFGQTTTDADLARAAKNPYDLARYIESHSKIEWTPLQKAWRVADFPGMPACGPCNVDLITVLRPTQVILAINGFPSDVYLRFLQVGSGWRFAGSYNDFKKNFGGRHEITRTGDKPFLRVSSQGANGSDWDSEVEAWLDLSRPDFAPVFEFTVQGNEHRATGVSRWVRATATPGPEDSTQTIEVDLEVRFTMHYERDLGFAKYTATYQRAPGQKRFALREVRPFLDHGRAISNQDYEKLANIEADDGISNELLLDFALPGLKEIATGSNAEEREWLRSILGFSKNTPAKRTLQNLLDRKR